MTVQHKGSASDNATNVTLNLIFPNYVIYDHYTSNGSRPPDDVTINSNNQLSIKMKVIHYPERILQILLSERDLNPGNWMRTLRFSSALCFE